MAALVKEAREELLGSEGEITVEMGIGPIDYGRNGHSAEDRKVSVRILLRALSANAPELLTSELFFEYASN